MKTWIAESLNPKYDRKTCGVQFQNGKAVINDAVIDKTVGLKAAQIVDKLQKDFPITDPETGKTTQSFKVRLVDGKEAAE